VAASTNGQLMPPIMGAAAFIIAELVGISYFDVIVAAIIPALVAYIGLLYISHLEALKLGLKRMPAIDIPPLGKTFLGGAHFLVPILVLVYLLMIERWSASSSVFYTIMVMFLIIIASRVAPAGLPKSLAGILYAVPVLLAALVRGFSGAEPQTALFLGLAAALLLVAGLAVVKQAREGGLGAGLAGAAADIRHGLIAGARNMIGIAVAVAAAGIIVGSVSSTGLNNAMVGLVEALSGGNVFILLILTAVLALILGMGLPTTANYLVVASLLAGVLVELGGAAGLRLEIVAVHLFVFYFGILADVTPPVCLAAFAASAISRADPLKTGVQGFFYDIRTAILPFMFIFNPELLLIGVTSFWHGLSVFVVSLIAIFCFASATQGWLLVRTRLHEIVLLLAVAFALFRPDFFLDLVHPAYAPQPMERFLQGRVMADKGLKLRLHVVRETDYGDRFKLFTFSSPGGAVGQKSFGLGLEPAKDGRHAVADLAFMKAAEKAKMEPGDFVTAIDLEQTGRPAKEWVFPWALLVLGLVFVSQFVRHRQAKAAAP
jgi:TRAP transporter 4TM/12TM fusion protein